MMDEDTDETAAEKLRRYAERHAFVGQSIEDVTKAWESRFLREQGTEPTALGRYYFIWHVNACRDVLERLGAGNRSVH